MNTPRFLAILLALVSMAGAQVAPRLTYRVEVKEGDSSAFHHALEIDRPGTDAVRLSVAAWAPGSYRLMNVFKNIVNVAAVDERGTDRLVRKDGDLTWIVDAKDAGRLVVSWKFQGLDKGVNNRSYLNQTGGLLDGPRNYLYWRDRKDLPAHVHFELPDGWKVATGLTPTFDPMVYWAADTDWLLDCPVLVGKLESWTFDVGGVPHRVALDNRARPVDFDAAAFVEHVRGITRTCVDLWGFIPYSHYTYLFTAGGGGGLEHLTSTTIGVNTRSLASNPASHQSVIAHELYHAWNVKRLRPKALGPFDYDGPVRTKSLWIAEGITNYYTNVILSRGGFVDESEFLAGYERTIGGFVSNPASRVVSPEEASWTVWDLPYLSGPIDYYTQGEILGLLMDLEIRGKTQNRKSLDDAMKLLYERYSGRIGYQSEDVVGTILDATGVDLHAFFLDHVSGAREIDWPRYFRHMGVVASVIRRPRTAIAFESVQSGEGGVVVNVAEDSALSRLGVRTGDVVVSMNGKEVKTSRDLLEVVRALEVDGAIIIEGHRKGSPFKLEGTVRAATDLQDLLGRRGSRMVVTRLPSDSELARSGFMNGDVVKSVNGVAVTNREEYRARVAGIGEGEVAKVSVERGGVELVLEHRAGRSASVTFSLQPDPAAGALELEIRRSLILGNRQGGDAAGRVPASRPARRAG